MDVGFWADLAGVLGLALSLFIAISGAIKARENYIVRVIDYADFGGTTRFLISISNNSRTPLVITEISYQGTICELEPKKVRGNPEAWNGATTPRFPLCIPAGGAQFAYIEFLLAQHIPLSPGTTVTFQIRSTLLLEQKIVVLGRTSHYLHRKE